MKLKIIAVTIILIMVLGSFGYARTNTNLEIVGFDDKPLKITVDWVEKIDPMDITGSPEWYFIIKVFKSGTDYTDPQIVEEYADGTYDHWDVEKSYSFDVYSNIVPISITLKEKDLALYDTADISAKLGDSPEDEDGKIFTIYYDVNKDEITPRFGNEKWETDDDYIMMNGELDGRGTMGSEEDDEKEDDAKMRIKIEDNIDELTVQSFSIEGNPSYIPPNEDITFLCSIQGGYPPFKYMIYPLGKSSSEGVTVDSPDRSISKSCAYDSSVHGYKTPYLWITDHLGTDIAYEMPNSILVDTPPNKPSKPSYVGYLAGVGHKYSTSGATDPDSCANLEYQWNYDGQLSEWRGIDIYLEKKPNSIKVKARDDGDCDGEFDDGLESEWSEALPKTKFYHNFNLLDFLMQRIHILSKIPINL